MTMWLAAFRQAIYIDKVTNIHMHIEGFGLTLERRLCHGFILWSQKLRNPLKIGKELHCSLLKNGHQA